MAIMDRKLDGSTLDIDDEARRRIDQNRGKVYSWAWRYPTAVAVRVELGQTNHHLRQPATSTRPLPTIVTTKDRQYFLNATNPSSSIAPLTTRFSRAGYPPGKCRCCLLYSLSEVVVALYFTILLNKMIQLVVGYVAVTSSRFDYLIP
mmetsp:Transcript_31260/g.42705  ORF Transcript_31260/g.42705 Transcript_31260/m.42705 type:complete len:148 (-) Transcript_31260:920-1363(-)